MWQERAEYGHFFYRIPNGESAADAYDRVSGFNESLWRSFKEDDFASVCVLVTHGLMTRVFLMKWYHWSVEYFEDLRNVNHCEFVVMALGASNGKYMLKNQLRTWTQFKREQEQAQAQAQAQAEVERQRRLSEAGSPSLIPLRKRWGTAHDHEPHLDYRPPRRQNTADLFRDDAFERLGPGFGAAAEHTAGGGGGGGGGGLVRKLSTRSELNTPNEPDIPEEEPGTPTQELTPAMAASPQYGSRGRAGTSSSRPGNPREYSPNRLAIYSTGRDGGGTHSGRASYESSDTEDIRQEVQALALQQPPQRAAAKGEYLSEEERRKQFRPPRSMALAMSGKLDGEGEDGRRKGAMADALGDQSDMDDSEDEEVRRVREAETGFEGSVR